MKIDSGKIGEHFVCIELLKEGLLVDMASEAYPYDIIASDPQNINNSVKIDVKSKQSGGWMIPNTIKKDIVYVFVDIETMRISGWMEAKEIEDSRNEKKIVGINLKEKFFEEFPIYANRGNNIVRYMQLKKASD